MIMKWNETIEEILKERKTERKVAAKAMVYPDTGLEYPHPSERFKPFEYDGESVVIQVAEDSRNSRIENQFNDFFFLLSDGTILVLTINREIGDLDRFIGKRSRSLMRHDDFFKYFEKDGKVSLFIFEEIGMGFKTDAYLCAHVSHYAAQDWVERDFVNDAEARDYTTYLQSLLDF